MKVVVQIKSEQLNKDDFCLLLRAIRDYEQANLKDKEVSIEAEVVDLTVDEMGEILKSVEPSYTHGPVTFKYKRGIER